MKACLFIWLLCLCFVSELMNVAAAADDSSVVIIIRSQANEYHHRVATEKKAELDAQIEAKNLNAKVVLLHREWPIESAWVILPLLADISRKYSDQYNWFMFIEDGTRVDIKMLTENVLPKYDFQEEMYLGRCLHDNEITIIHHFAFHDGKVREFNFPDFHAGWIMSKALVNKLANEWDPSSTKTDFQIDVQHEIAMILNTKFNVKMTCAEGICGSNDGSDCATWIDFAIPDCGSKFGLDDVFFGVKTTEMFHRSRVQVVKDTWGKYPKHIVYYSNVTDESIPTHDCGVPNTERGHCGKMEAIINDMHKKEDYKRFQWLVIADDDSIIGVSQLVKLLNCYNSKMPLVLGERYGFGLNTGQGYGYITGGGGMVMSRGAIGAWAKKGCRCPTIDTPDDMLLGQCFSYNVGVPVTHSPRFHQARPNDYSDGYLGNLQPVSFHKHWEVDPVKVYRKWFEADDEAAYASPPPIEPTQAPEPMPVPIPPTPTEAPPKDEL